MDVPPAAEPIASLPTPVGANPPAPADVELHGEHEYDDRVPDAAMPELQPRLPAETGTAAPSPHHAEPGETVEYDVETAFSEDDVLEETPEFLQDTPDHDRLWFEQKPPKDFDFDK
jgi:hypothetical protein